MLTQILAESKGGIFKMKEAAINIYSRVVLAVNKYRSKIINHDDKSFVNCEFENKNYVQGNPYRSRYPCRGSMDRNE